MNEESEGKEWRGITFSFLADVGEKAGSLAHLGDRNCREKREREREEDPPENWGERKGNGEMWSILKHKEI